MAGRPALRNASELMVPAVEEMLAAIDAPAEDAALVAAVRICARTIDEMAPAVRAAMLANVLGPMLRTLKELDDRARKRGRQDGPRPANPVRELRAQHAAFMGGGKRR
jgi:hypothetical protein